jgi:hypothetical protein
MMMHMKPVADRQLWVEPESNGILLATILDETRATATREQEREFLLAIGHRLSVSFALDGLVNLNELQDGMNHVWQKLDLGSVTLSVDPSGIGIRHIRSAQRGVVLQAQWDLVEPAILEGIYAGWFGAIGNDRLSIKRVALSHDSIDYHYGR